MSSSVQRVKLLCENLDIKSNIICLLHYGSVKQREDFTNTSDLDFHLVLKNLNSTTLVQIKEIFGFSNKIDLTYLTLDEVICGDQIIFNNGNQGIYFMHILASSEILVGENIYKKLILKANESKINRSIIEKVRYYIWLLRRNFVFENDILIHKKYFVRILKDILILQKIINYENISKFNNRQIISLFIENNHLEVNEIVLINSLINLENVKSPKIPETLTLFKKFIDNIVWKNLEII